MLKFIKLCHSQHLTKTPDFSGTPKLRRLIFKDCTSLVEVHPSIGALKELIFLNLEGCKMLNSFPSSIHMESLQILILSGCSKLKIFPEVQGEMGNLSELYLDGTAIRELPSSIEHLNGLVLLNLANCNQLENLPESIGKLTSLQTLKLYGCSKLKKCPDELGSLQCLEELNADGTAIEEVPPSITLLSKLKVLSLAGCKGGVSMSWNLVLSFWSSLPRKHLRLPSLLGLNSLRSLNLSDCGLLEGALPTDLASLSSLQNLDLSRNSFITVPGSLSQLSRLQNLILKHCKSLQSLPELPSSIETLDCDDCTSLESFSCPSRAYASRRSGGFTFKFSNCFRIVENELQSDVLEAIVLGIQLVASIPKFLDPEQVSFCLFTLV